MDYAAVLQCVQQRMPHLLAVYAFGSHTQGCAGPDSDVDLAVLVAGYADPVLLWETAGDLSQIVCAPVDLVDLRAASTVMQHQILSTGRRLWAQDVLVDVFEAALLSEKTALDEARALLLGDVARNGSVHGR